MIEASLRTARPLPRLLAILTALALVATACGGGGDDVAASDPTSPTASIDDGGVAGEADGTGGDGAAGEVAAGDGLFLYPPVEGAVLRLETTGIAASTSTVTVQRVTVDGGDTTVEVTEVVESGGESVTVERSIVTRADGSMALSASSFAATGPGFRVTATGDDAVMPSISDLEAGSGRSGTTFVEFEGDGFSGRNDVAYTVTGEGFETVDTPLGPVEAYKATIALDIDSSLGGRQQGTTTFWMVPGFAGVRQQVTIGGSQLTTVLAESSVSMP